MEVGLTSVTFRSLDYENILDFCVKSGLSCIEWGSDVHAPEQDLIKVEAVKAASVRAGIRICSYGSYYKICAHENYKEAFRPYLEAATILEAPIIRLWAGTVGACEASKEYYEQAVKETQALCDMAADYNITLAFEFHRNSLSDTADNAIRIYKDINKKNFGLYYQYDPLISIKENLASVEKMLPYIKMIHVAYSDKKYKKMSLEEGEGIRLWTGITEKLKEHHIEADLLFEFLKDTSLEGLMYEAKIMKGILDGTNTMKYSTPEAVGVSSENIQKFVETLEQNHFATHDIIMARGNQIFFEKYWEPFHKNFLHRMYSVSKSFVALAIGFLVQDGLIDLDDKISKYFVEELKNQSDENMHNQTIRHMLMMSTAKSDRGWFKAKTDDRVRHYFENATEFSRPPGTLFEYDSSGSFVMGALVERIIGKPFMEYLREKLFCKIGVSEEAYCLKCPGGHSWSDSAVLCRPIDLMLVARFVLNGGSWNGEQILNEQFVKKATSKQIDNNYLGINDFNTQGYGYQFWMTYQNSFFFNGMGSQYAVCVPEQDIIMVINSDNQGKEAVRKIIFDSFFELIVNQAKNVPLPENKIAYEALLDYTKDLRLLTAQGEKHSDCEQKVNDVTYIMNKNPMGISRIRLTFEGDRGCFAYTNEQGDKEFGFGLGHNEFGVFPQEGYSSEVGSQEAPGNYYKCAASAAWVEDNKLRIVVQIIDRYFGNMSITLGFKDREVGVFMHRTAECFLEEYQGYGLGRKED